MGNLLSSLFNGNNKDKKVVNDTNKKVIINENIFSIFQKGYPNSTSIPTTVDFVRLRGTDIDPTAISFSYKIS